MVRKHAKDPEKGSAKVIILNLGGNQPLLHRWRQFVDGCDEFLASTEKVALGAAKVPTLLNPARIPTVASTVA